MLSSALARILSPHQPKDAKVTLKTYQNTQYPHLYTYPRRDNAAGNRWALNSWCSPHKGCISPTAHGNSTSTTIPIQDCVQEPLRTLSSPNWHSSGLRDKASTLSPLRLNARRTTTPPGLNIVREHFPSVHQNYSLPNAANLRNHAPRPIDRTVTLPTRERSVLDPPSIPHHHCYQNGLRRAYTLPWPTLDRP
jgi:hypothetical protein